MSKSYSKDLRERVVMAVERDGVSRRRAAARFGVSYLTREAAKSRRRFRARGATGCLSGAGARSSDCAIWSPNWPHAAWRLTTVRCGSSSTPRS